MCDQCGGHGYLGRIGIYEVLQVSDSIRKLIIRKTASDEIEKQAVSEGMTLMLQDGLNKVSAGLTTIEEIIRAVKES